MKLPSEYLRGIVFLSDRSNSIEEMHKIRLEYLTQLIENKKISETIEKEINISFLCFKKKVQNSPKDALISIFLQCLSSLFPELKNESISFSKTGVLEVRSQNLKLWRERFIKFNYYSKTIEIYKNSNKGNKKPKYSFILTGYVIRWIDKEKCLFSLDSINYLNKYKNYLFLSKDLELLKDWYENIKFALSFDKIYEFECYEKRIENFKIIDHIQNPNKSNDKANELLIKKRYYSKSVLSLLKNKGNINNYVKSNLKNKNPIQSQTSEKPKHLKIPIKNEFFNCLSFYEPDNSNFFETNLYEIKKKNSLIEQKYDGEYRKTQMDHKKNLVETKFYDAITKNQMINHSNLLSEEESNKNDNEVEEFQFPQKLNISKMDQPLFQNSVNVHQFDKIVENFNLEKMNNEVNYELVSCKNNLRIMRKILNKKKFKVFLTFPYYLPMMEALFLDPNLIKKWNENILEYKILSILCQEKKLSLVYEERKKFNLLYLKRYLIFQRFVCQKDENTTLIICKSMNHPNSESIFSIRSILNFSILSISQANFQTKIAFFIDIENKGFLTRKQDDSMTISYLNMFENIRKIIENSFIMEILNNNIETSLNKNKTSLKPLRKITEIAKNSNLEQNILKKRKSNPILLNLNSFEVEKLEGSQERTLKQILRDIKENYYVQNCIQQSKKQQRHKSKEHFFMDKFDYLFAKKYWNILSSGKFEYLESKLIKRQINFFQTSLKENINFKDIKLPLFVHEPLSELEKITYLFSFAPLIFKDLSEFDKPLDQMKIVIIFVFSFLFLAVSQKIPFPSTLGETFQSKIDDFQIYAEKISIEPNIIFVLIMNEFVKIEAKFALEFEINNNICKIKNNGFIQLCFEKTKTKFYASLPSLFVQGILEFPRTLHYENNLIVIEKEKCLFSEITFAKKEKFNEFYGEIHAVTKKFIALIIEKKSWKHELENEKIKKECKIYGSLSSSIEFDGKIYWSFDKHYPYHLRNIENPLPSDSKYRKDIIFFKLGIDKKADFEENILNGDEMNFQNMRKKWKNEIILNKKFQDF